jgi:DNA-directed RNA polymerase specialized sigma24 family protein
MAKNQMTKTYVDFNTVEPGHHLIHADLENWALWVRVSHRSPWTAPAMFRECRSNAWQWHTPEHRENCDLLAAQAMEKAVSKLPPTHRAAVRWRYVFKGSPRKMANSLGLTLEGLAKHARDGVQMLCNTTGAREVK